MRSASPYSRKHHHLAGNTSAPTYSDPHRNSRKEIDMGKYFIGWLLGIPAVLLVLLYLIFH